ncbi:MAG TPA: NUDIX domain-containing protein [Gaiellales bacterium]|nr:NUDIX domain-containing protein [Gaiellales bacterium]
MSAPQVWPLDRVPPLRSVPPPDLNALTRDRIECVRTRLAAHPTMTDEPILMVAAATPAELSVYPATYAWHAADRAAPLPGTQGGLGVQLALTAGDDMLWQRRGPGVDHPGYWSISVAGCAVPGAGLADQIRDEAREELGLDPGHLADLRPLALVVPAEGRTVQVVFHARLADGVRPAPDGVEAVDVRKARAPEELPGAVDPLTAAWWSVLAGLLRAAR